MNIEIHPEWLLKKQDGSAIALPLLLRLLNHIREQGSIRAAAASVDLSYRHAWGMLREFESRFGVALVQKARGYGTILSPLAEKLIWADKRIAARLSPILDSLASELEQELKEIFAGNQPALRITASHGFAIDALIREIGAQGAAVDLRYRSSTEAVAALSQGECDLAGFHLPLGEFRQAAATQYLQWFNPRRHSLIHLAYRTQGLFVAKGNPKNIADLRDLKRRDVRFVNRQAGSGTRMLLELMLKKLRLRTTDILGYESAEFTHAAVAAYVASGMADVSFGVEAAARHFDLDFIPVLRERYFLACHAKDLTSGKLEPVLGIMRGKPFQDVVNRLAGYDGTQSGTVVTGDAW